MCHMYTECIIKHIPYKPDQGYSEHLRLRRLCCNYIYSYGGRNYNSFGFFCSSSGFKRSGHFITLTRKQKTKVKTSFRSDDN